MDENPYQSPSAACEPADPFSPSFPLVASFSWSRDLLRRACRSYVVENPILILIGIGVGAIGLSPAIIFPDVADGVPILFASICLMAWVVLVWAAGAVFLFRRTVRCVGEHPVLSIIGMREVRLTSDSITVASADQSATWPLRGVLIRGSKTEFLILELNVALILVVPRDATVDPQPFDVFRHAVQRRLRRHAWSNFCLMR